MTSVTSYDQRDIIWQVCCMHVWMPNMVRSVWKTCATDYGLGIKHAVRYKIRAMDYGRGIKYKTGWKLTKNFKSSFSPRRRLVSVANQNIGQIYFLLSYFCFHLFSRANIKCKFVRNSTFKTFLFCKFYLIASRLLTHAIPSWPFTPASHTRELLICKENLLLQTVQGSWFFNVE